jgi:head-tail adaptor
MNAGRLNTRISVNRYTKVADDFGGYTSTEAVLKNVWCHLKEIKGDVSAENGMTQRRVTAELILRKKAADEVRIGDTINIDGQADKFEINNMYQSELDFYTTIVATNIV